MRSKDGFKKQKDLAKRRKVISILVFVVGLVVLIAGIVVLVLKLNKGPAIQDGEYLMSAKEWKLEEEDGVVWDFTEIGKGTLTTNGHLNDYEFIWALEDRELKIETDWLYDLENQYKYELDQGAGTLTLKDGEKTFKFVRVEEN